MCVCVCVCVCVCIYTHTDLWALMDGGAMPVGVVSRTSVFNVGFGGMLESWMQEMRGTNTKEKIYKVSALVSLLYKAPIGNTFENVCLGREAAVEQAVELLTNS